MPKKSGKLVSLDAMIKFFMNRFEIPTRIDIQKLIMRLDQLEKTIKKSTLSRKSRSPKNPGPSGAKSMLPHSGKTSHATSTVWEAIRNSEQGLNYSEISKETGFDEKKIRNIIYRLHKTGKIQRKSRGIYIVE